MKKIFLLLILMLVFSACSSDVQENKIEDNKPPVQPPVEEQKEVEINNSQFEEFLDDVKFNKDLNQYEKEWLGYLEVKYPKTKIYHIKTKDINCENCYDLSYKRDREVIIIQVRDGQKTAEKRVTDDIAVEIENEDVCKLFKGSWNECPLLCNTDEEACKTECGLPVCEFDYNTIEFKKIGEECGGLDKGDCEYGLSCVYENKEDKYGICE